MSNAYFDSNCDYYCLSCFASFKHKGESRGHTCPKTNPQPVLPKEKPANEQLSVPPVSPLQKTLIQIDKEKSRFVIYENFLD